MNSYLNTKVLKAIWPVCFGYIPLGLACGVLAQKVGVDPIAVGIMSAVVFAGSGQFVALAMIGSGSAIISIVVTVFIVNLRYIFYSIILNNYVKEKSSLYKMFFCHEIVDETAAVIATQFEQDKEWTHREAIAAGQIAHTSWILSTIAGAILGSVVYMDTALVSYALTSMFICLWAFHFCSRKLVLAGIFTGIMTLVLSPWLTNMLNVVVATLVCSILAVFIGGEPDDDNN